MKKREAYRRYTILVSASILGQHSGWIGGFFPLRHSTDPCIPESCTFVFVEPGPAVKRP